MAINVVRNPAQLTWAMFQPVTSIPGTTEEAQIAPVTSGLERFRPSRGSDGRFTMPSLTITVGIDRRNTIVLKTANKSAQLLAHEQSHLDLLFLTARALARELESVSAESVDDLAASLQEIRDRHAERAEAIDKAYDSETDHSRNRAQQQKWDAAIVRAMADRQATEIERMPL